MILGSYLKVKTQLAGGGGGCGGGLGGWWGVLTFKYFWGYACYS